MLNLDLKGEAAKVALLAVDKAFYGLQADNKLTGKQVTLSDARSRNTTYYVRVTRFSCFPVSGLFHYAVV